MVHLRLRSSSEEIRMITKSEARAVDGEMVVVEVVLMGVAVVRHKRSSSIWSKPNQQEMNKPNQLSRIC